MNRTPVTPKKPPEGSRVPQKQSRDTSVAAYRMIFGAGAISFVLAILLIVLLCLHPNVSQDKPSEETTAPPETSGDATHVAVTYPTAPSRDSYLLSGNGTAIDKDSISATSAILVSLKDYTVTASVGADERIYPASMTKIMTLIVACENIKDASVLLTLEGDVIDYCKREGATRLTEDAGDVFSATDMLYSVGVISAADACITLANHIAGSEEEFVKLMNDKASELGLTGTHFANCTGLDDDANYSTAREMAIILAYALDNPFCREILSTDYKNTVGYYMNDGVEDSYNRQLYNTLWDRLAQAGYEKHIPADLSCGMTLLGGKTGHTDKGKWCLASFLEDADGNLYVTVTAAGERIGTSITDMEAICKNYT